MAEAQRSSDIYGILLNPDEPGVLLMRTDAGWTLPHFHVPDKRIFIPMVAATCQEIGSTLGANVTVLSNVHTSYSEDRLHVDLIYLLENHSENWALPAEAMWVMRNQLETLALQNSEHRTVIEAALQETTSGNISPLRQAWAYPGWFAEASGWMQDQLTQQKYIFKAPIEQIKSWGISCLLRAQTDRGDVYFKVATSLPLFGNEPALMKALSERYPDYVPAPLAIDLERRWLLLPDFGAELRDTMTLERLETAAQRLGQLQLRTVSAVDDLLAIGCLDRRPDILASQIDALLSDVEALAPMTADEVDRIRSLGPHLKAMCSELAHYQVPHTLNHGDLHTGNITAQTLQFFDWTDACIAHPFFDLSTLIMDAEEIPDARERCVDAYLNLWLDYAPMDRLRDLWKIAEPLGALHQAVSYQHILAALEPTSKQEFIWGVPIWLRRVIKTMPN